MIVRLERQSCFPHESCRADEVPWSNPIWGENARNRQPNGPFAVPQSDIDGVFVLQCSLNNRRADWSNMCNADNFSFPFLFPEP